MSERVWDVDEAFLEQFEAVIVRYLGMAGALADDDFNAARTLSEEVVEILE